MTEWRKRITRVSPCFGCWCGCSSVRFFSLVWAVVVAVIGLGGCGLFNSDSEVAVHVPFASQGKFTVQEIGGSQDVVASGNIESPGNGASDGVGTFTVGENHSGLKVSVSELQFEDPASGVTTIFDGEDSWSALLAADSTPPDITVNPFTTLASCAAEARLPKNTALDDDAVSSAVVTANDAFARHLGIDHLVELILASPLDPVGNISGHARYGLWLAALSQLASDHSEETGISAGSLLTMVTLTKRLCSDVSGDLVFDGNGPAGPVRHGSVAIDDQTLRLGLARGLYRFLSGTRNRTSLGAADTYGLTDTVTFNASTILFPAGRPVYPFETDPPRIQFLDPKGVWEGTILDVHVTADDAPGVVVELRAFIRFPLSGLEVEIPNAAGSADVFEGTIDLTEFGNGPALLEVVAKDLIGNEAEASMNLTVKVP